MISGTIQSSPLYLSSVSYSANKEREKTHHCWCFFLFNDFVNQFNALFSLERLKSLRRKNIEPSITNQQKSTSPFNSGWECEKWRGEKKRTVECRMFFTPHLVLETFCFRHGETKLRMQTAFLERCVDGVWTDLVIEKMWESFRQEEKTMKRDTNRRVLSSGLHLGLLFVLCWKWWTLCWTWWRKYELTHFLHRWWTETVCLIGHFAFDHHVTLWVTWWSYETSSF